MHIIVFRTPFDERARVSDSSPYPPPLSLILHSSLSFVGLVELDRIEKNSP